MTDTKFKNSKDELNNSQIAKGTQVEAIEFQEKADSSKDASLTYIVILVNIGMIVYTTL